MEQSITASGTVVFELPSGIYRVDQEGTIASGCTIDLKAGSDLTGANHLPVADPDGVDVQWNSAGTRRPFLLQGCGRYSLVTASFGASSDVKIVFRKSDMASG